MYVILALLTGAVGILLWTKQTRWYELLLLGGFGFLLACAILNKSFGDLSPGMGTLFTRWFE